MHSSPSSAPCAHTVARLRCLRGIDTLTALGLCAEIGEWERFDHPDQLASYLGIVPSEHTTGSQRRLGSITKAGSTHARRLLIEAAYHYRRGPAVGEALERRQRGQAPEIIHISWRAQRRLTPAGASSKTPATNQAGSSRSRSPASSPPTAGRSPPSPLIPIRFRRHPCRRATPSRTQPRSHTSTHQPPARGSPTHAQPHRHPVAAGEAARASPARAHHSAIRRLSTRPTRRPRSTIDSGRATNKGLGVHQPPNMSMTERREPADARAAPQAATTSIPHTNQTMAINPYPLTPAPPIWATEGSRGTPRLPDSICPEAALSMPARGAGETSPLSWERQSASVPSRCSARPSRASICGPLLARIRSRRSA